MRHVYFILVNEFDTEQLVTMYAYITDKPAYKNRYMAHVQDADNDEILFYESHPSAQILKDRLEACMEEFGYIIFSYKEHSFPNFHWYD
jgi:hypothetical protein